MTLRLHNTLTRLVEPLQLGSPGTVLLYACGPTVHARAHVGNLRTFLFVDCLRRHLEATGLAVRHVMNITDVEDKIIRKAGAAGTPIETFTAPFVDAFHRDVRRLRLRPAHAYPHATAYIGQMLELVRRLEAKGFTYIADGSVYFRVDAFPPYGRLARLDVDGLRAGGSGRVDADEYEVKEQARDFVLWKAVAPGEGASWPSPYGPGRPGWHLECSTIAMAELGETVDVHCGGVDLIFPHHENEIAQSEAATGRPFVRTWVHTELLHRGGAKMAKSVGNLVTLSELEEAGVDPLTVRFHLLAGAHYRRTLHFREEDLAGAAEAVGRLAAFWRRCAEVGRPGPEPDGARGDPLAAVAEDAGRRFTAALDDDLNLPAGVAVAFDLVREGNRLLDRGEAQGAGARAAARALLAIDDVLGCIEAAAGAGVADAPLSSAAQALLQRRETARRAGDFAAADRVRAELRGLGIVVEDQPQGTRWRRVG